MRQFLEQSSLVILGMMLGALLCFAYICENHISPRDAWVKGNFGKAATFDATKRTYVYKTSEEKPVPSLKEIVEFELNRVLAKMFSKKKANTKVNNEL